MYLAQSGPDDEPPLEVGFEAVEVSGVVLRKRLTDSTVGATREDVGFDRSTTNEAVELLRGKASTLFERV